MTDHIMESCKKGTLEWVFNRLDHLYAEFVAMYENAFGNVAVLSQWDLQQEFDEVYGI